MFRITCRWALLLAAWGLAVGAVGEYALPVAADSTRPIYAAPNFTEFKAEYSCVAWPDRVAIRRMADGREESVFSGRPGHAVPNAFRKLIKRTPEFNADCGSATSARTAVFDDSLQVQVFEGGALFYEPSTGRYRWFKHRRRTVIGRNEAEPLPGEIVAYDQIPTFVGKIGMTVAEGSVMLTDNGRWLSERVDLERKSYPLGDWVQVLLKKNPAVAGKLGAAISSEQSMFGGAVRIQIFDGGVIVHEKQSGKNRVAWHAPRGWAVSPTDIAGLPTAPGSVLRPDGRELTLTHPSGARVEIPAGAIYKSSRPTLETAANIPPVAPLRPLGPAVQLMARTLLNAAQPINIDLPVGESAERAVVMVLNQGRWLRIPSSSVTLADGRAGQRVRLAGVSFPWTLMAAAVPDDLPVHRGLVGGTSSISERLRLEQLRWTDRPAYLAALRALHLEASRSLAGDDLAALGVLTKPTPSKTDPRLLFERAQLCLLKADPELGGDRAVPLYFEGLELLWQARNACPTGADNEETAVDRTYDPETKELVEVGSGWRLEQIIEQYCGRYCPWGVQMILELHRKGELKADQFDLRVIPEYGSLAATDVLIHQDEYVPSHLPWTIVDAMQQSTARDLGILSGKAHRRTVLRFWSPQVMDWQLSDLIAAYQTCDGWASWLLALGKLAFWAEGGVTVGVVYEAGMPVLESLFIDELLGDVKKESPSWGMAVGMGYQSVNKIGGWIAEGEQIASRKNLRDLYTTVFLAWWLDRSQLEMYQRIREASEATAGYANHSLLEGVRRFRVPPVMLLTTVWGPTTDSRSREPRVGVYPLGAQALIAWTPNYSYFAARGATGYDLHEAFARRAAESFAWHDLDRSWQPFRQEDWVYLAYDSDPIEQQVAFYLDRRQVDALAAARQVSVDRLFHDLLVDVRIGEPTSTNRFYPASFGDLPLQECHRSTTEDIYWFAVRLRGKLADWREPAETPAALVEMAYDGPVLTTSFRPHRQYSIVIKGKKDREASFILPAIFDLKESGTERRTDQAAETYVDRTTARVAETAGRWYSLLQVIDGKETKTARLYWEPQGARARATLDVPVPPQALGEWLKATGLASPQIELTAECNPQAQPMQYSIRDERLAKIMERYVLLAASLGNDMLGGLGDIVRSPPTPGAAVSIVLHDFLIIVVPSGPELQVRVTLDCTVAAGGASRRHQIVTQLRAVPE